MVEGRNAIARAAPWLGLGLLLVLTAIAYAPSLDGPFVLDDWGSVEGNARLRQPDALHLPSVPEMLGTSRPVTEATFVVDWRAAGPSPRRFRVVALALHLAAVVAAFAWVAGLLLRAGHPRARALALIVAALFALHPIQVDAVAYVSQRAEVLSALLSLLALLLLDVAARRWRAWTGAMAWLAGTAAWIVAMGAKAVAIGVPGVFLLDQAVVAPPAERGARAAADRVLRAALVVAPIVALVAWSAALHMRAFEEHPEGGAGFTATGLTAGQYLLTQFRVQWLYLRLLAWPSGFAFDRVFEPSLSVDAGVILAGLGIAALVALAAWLWIRAERAGTPSAAARLVAFGILFWFVALSPTSSIVPVKDLAVEHRVYLACLGPFLAATVVVDLLLHRWLASPASRIAGRIVAGAAVLLLAVLLRSRAEAWGSVEEFWREAATASPGNARILTNYGIALQRKGNVAGAEAVYRQAWTVARSPERVARLAGNHAALLLDSGRPAEALAVSDRGLALAPGDPVLWVNRAVALGTLGRNAEALADARLAAAASPGDPRMQRVLGMALSANGDWGGALQAFRAAASLDPGVPLYPVMVAVSLGALGRRDEACAAFRDVAARTRMRPLPQNAAARAAALGCPIQ